MPPPKFAIKRGDHQELVDPSTHDPLKVEAIDQVVFVDTERGEQYVRLFPKMTADQLRAKIASLEIKSSGHKYLHCDEGALQHYRTILKEVFPEISFAERETTDAGIHQVPGRTTFVFHTDYWRAIAKIGFHYYLLNNTRGFRGDESEFADIRRFIIEGGDHGLFFTNPVVQFALPFGELPDGRAILPEDWAHVLAADESTQAAVAMVTLFIGPKRLAPTYHINLGRFRNPLIVPDARYVHTYLYQPNQSQYAGQVVAMTTTRLL
jgi:hypothetical protein